MNKQWTSEERLAAINFFAYQGFNSGEIKYFVLIGALTNAQADLLNSDPDIQDFLKEMPDKINEQISS